MKHLTAGMMLAAALPALADGQATIATSESHDAMQMEIRWADDRMRMDFPSQQQGYMLMRDGKGYMVTEQNGQTVIIDMAMLKEMSEADAANASQAQSVESLEATGETETVAGIEGEIYRIQWTDRGGNAHDDDIVLSDDPLAHEMLQAFQSYIGAVMDESDPIGSALLDRELGMLRFGGKFKIVEITDTAPATDTFELPEDAMTMQDMMQQQMERSAGAQ